MLALAAPLHATTVTIGWDPNPEPDVTGYIVHWGSQSHVYTASQAVGRVTSWVTPDLASGRTYYFAVQAVNVDGLMSPLSEEVSISPGTTSRRFVTGDFDGDGKAHAAVFRRSTGEWYVRGITGVQFGMRGDIPVPGDYDGDLKMDVAVYRPSTGVWWILSSSNASTTCVQWGNPGSRDVPLPADYDGDGKTDVAIYRPETGVWWLLKASANFSYSSARTLQWGNPGSEDVPVPGDYDGDGRADLAIWRPGTGVWWLLRSSSDYSYAGARTVQWGVGAERDVPVPADYDGDGTTDIAVWRPRTGTWWVLRSRDEYSWGTALTVQWGVGSLEDVPVPADHDGDGRADLAIYRPGSASWYVRCSAGEYTTYWNFQYGDRSQGDVPVGPGIVNPSLFLN